MNDGIDNIREFYNEFQFENGNRSNMNARHFQIANTLQKYFRKIGTVLDLGCGFGQLSRAMAAYGHKVTAVDFSSRRIKEAEEYDNNRYGINYVCQDVYEYLNKNAGHSFDYILLCDILEHVEAPDQLLEELRRYISFETKVYVNVPYYFLTAWLQKNKPHLLQIIDDPVHVFDVISFFESCDLFPIHLQLNQMQYVEIVFADMGYLSGLYEKLYTGV